MKKLLNVYEANDIKLVYILDSETQMVGFTLIPGTGKEQYVLEGEWKTESLIQLKMVFDEMPSGFANGHSMRNSGSCTKMKYENQIYKVENGIHTIITVVGSAELKGTHFVQYKEGDVGIKVWTELENIGENEQCLEMISSFSLCGLFGFTKKERTQDFIMHRLRSKWSEEGRLESRSFLEMQMEPSWQRYGIQSIRYGQVGSMPVRRYFPWFALEDRRFHTFIAGSLSISSSWQIEIFSEDDRPAVSGGIADREFGHFMKKLKQGEHFVTPCAELTCCIGNLDDVTNRVTERQRVQMSNIPKQEENLPIVFNEFCSTWGKPSEERIAKLASALNGKGITYFVIDAGWYADPEKGWESNMGDWNPSINLFPNGIKKAADIIRKNGMVPGIWFEMETAGKDAVIYQDTEKLLTRDGYPITTGRRRFLDMRKGIVISYLTDKVSNCLKDNMFGYLKADYNDSIGLGCDGPESLGENLRVHMETVKDFYKSLHKELPDLVMENCSSGGHRLEPGMMELFSMASFSDAHECVSIPIIAANLHRAIQPAQSQIWAVIRKSDTQRRIRYLITSTFLGRMCISGDVDKLAGEQWETVEAGIKYYKKCATVIRDGVSYRFGPRILSYAHPQGYQVMVRKTEKEAIIIVHTFEHAVNIEEEIIKLQGFEIIDIFGNKGLSIRIFESGMLKVKSMDDFDGIVIYAKSKG